MTSMSAIISPIDIVPGNFCLRRNLRGGNTFQDCIAFATSLDYRMGENLETSLQDNDLERIAINIDKIIYVYKEETGEVDKYNMGVPGGTEGGTGYICLFENLSGEFFLIVELVGDAYRTQYSIYNSLIAKLDKLNTDNKL